MDSFENYENTITEHQLHNYDYENEVTCLLFSFFLSDSLGL